MYYVYVLENDTGKHYIGSCEVLTIRLKRHNQNSVRATKYKGPFKLVYQEVFHTRTEARKRENQIKRYKGNSNFQALLKSNKTLSSSLA